MIPLHEVRRPHTTPIVTRALVLAIAAAFAWQVALSCGVGESVGVSGGENGFLAQWGARPRCIVSPGACHIELTQISDRPWWILRRWLIPLVTSAFLHAGVWHLGLNVWFLWVFGPAVEEKLGRLKYLAFYVACAAASGLAYTASAPSSAMPLVGASGAIAGILGAHLILMPRSWIVSYIPPIWFVPIPSLVFLLFWMAGQLAGARLLEPLSHFGFSIGHAASSEANIAWAAHIGGFGFGALCAWRARPWIGARAQKMRAAQRSEKAAQEESARRPMRSGGRSST